MCRAAAIPVVTAIKEFCTSLAALGRLQRQQVTLERKVKLDYISEVGQTSKSGRTESAEALNCS